MSDEEREMREIEFGTLTDVAVELRLVDERMRNGEKEVALSALGSSIRAVLNIIYNATSVEE